MSRHTRLKVGARLAVAFIFILMLVSGGSQFFLSPRRIAQWLEQTLPDNNNLDIKFTKAQVSLSGSLFPLFGIKIKNVKIKYQDCDSSVQLNAPYVLIPFYVSEAVKKNFKFGYLKLGDVDLQVLDKENVCFSAEDEKQAATPQAKEASAQLLKQKDYKELFELLRKPFQSLKGLKVQKFSVYQPLLQLLDNPSKDLQGLKQELRFMSEEEASAKEGQALQEKIQSIKAAKKVEVSRLRLTYDYSEDSVLASARIKALQPGFEDFKRLPLFKTNLEFNKEKGLKLGASTHYNEGRFYINSKYQRDIEDLRFEWQAEDFPLSFVIRTFGIEKIFTQINPHLVWLNGSGELAINYRKKLATQILAKSFHLKGDLIEAYAQDVMLGVFPQVEVLQPFEWRLERLDLEQISDFLDYKGVRGVLRQVGHIRGAGVVNALDQVVFEGSVEGLEFFFSSDGQKVFQKVDEAEINIELMPTYFLMEFDRIFLGRGDVEGQTSFRLSRGGNNQGLNQDSYQNPYKNFYNWEFKSYGQSLRFNDDIYDLFLLKPMTFENFDIFVQGTQRYVEKINVDAFVQNCETIWGRFENLKLKLSSQQADRLNLEMQAKSFVINKNFIKAETVLPDANIQRVNASIKMNLKDNSNTLEFESRDRNQPFKIYAEDFEHKKEFNGVLTKSGKNFEVLGNMNSGYKLQPALEN